MSDIIVIALPGLGSLCLPDEIYRKYLQPIPPAQIAAPAAEGPQLIDAAAAAQRFSVPKSWLMEQARQGAVPSTMVGRYRRFDPAALAAHLATGTQPASRR